MAENVKLWYIVRVDLFKRVCCSIILLLRDLFTGEKQHGTGHYIFQVKSIFCAIYFLTLAKK